PVSTRRVQLLSAAVLDKHVKPGALAWSGIAAPPAAKGRLLVVNKGPSRGEKGRASIMLLDLASGPLAKTLPPPQGPHDVAIAPDQSFAVAPNYGLQPQGAPLAARGGTSLSVVDLRTETLRNIELPGFQRPHGVEWIGKDKVAVTVDGTRDDLSHG